MDTLSCDNLELPRLTTHPCFVSRHDLEQYRQPQTRQHRQPENREPRPRHLQIRHLQRQVPH